MMPSRHPARPFCRPKGATLLDGYLHVDAIALWIGDVYTGRSSVLLPPPQNARTADGLFAGRCVVDIDPSVAAIHGLWRHDDGSPCCLRPIWSVRLGSRTGRITHAPVHATSPSSRFTIPDLVADRLVGRGGVEHSGFPPRAGSRLHPLGAILSPHWPHQGIHVLWGSADGHPVGWERLTHLGAVVRPRLLTADGRLRTVDNNGVAGLMAFAAPPGRNLLGAVAALAFTAEQIAL